MAVFNQITSDMKRLIKLSAEIAKYGQMLQHHNEASDKRNFNPEKVDLIKKKIAELEVPYYALMEKYF